MPPKRYHALILIGTLVMLLLLGLHLLGVGYSNEHIANSLVPDAPSPSSSTPDVGMVFSQNLLDPNLNAIVHNKATSLETGNQINGSMSSRVDKQNYLEKQISLSDSLDTSKRDASEIALRQLASLSVSLLPERHQFNPSAPLTESKEVPEPNGGFSGLDSIVSASNPRKTTENVTYLSPIDLQPPKASHQSEVEEPSAQQQSSQPPQQTHYTPPIFAYTQVEEASSPDVGLARSNFDFSDRQQQHIPTNQENLFQLNSTRTRKRPIQNKNNSLVSQWNRMSLKHSKVAGTRLYPGPQVKVANFHLSNQTTLYYPGLELYRPANGSKTGTNAPKQSKFFIFKPNSAPQPVLNRRHQERQPVTVPACARQQAELAAKVHPESSWSSTRNISSALLHLVLFCDQDAEYPTKEVMRALELYAEERSIEQLLPQFLVQLRQVHRDESVNNHRLAEIQRQVMLDTLQPSISLLRDGINSHQQQKSSPLDESKLSTLFPSTSYERVCRSAGYMIQPRRAKNLTGKWKIIVNLPGHRYRGIAISQFVQVEECTRPMTECNGPEPSEQSFEVAMPVGFRSHCLQQYQTQRLVSWTSYEGLHVDLFRFPSGCGCYLWK